MKIKLLTQLRELIAAALKSQTSLSKSFQRFAHVRQPCQDICASARDGSLCRFNQNTVEQRCNGGSIYCDVWEIPEHAIK